MQEKYTSQRLDDFDGEINLKELFYILLKEKWIIVSLTAFASIFAVLYSLSLPNIYQSKALLAPVNPSSNISGAFGNYGNFPGVSGLNLFSDVQNGNAPKAIKQISSLYFFEKNILPNIYLPDLMAFKSWNPKTNTVTFDNDIYDTNTNTWIREYSYPRQQIPSAQESFKVFTTKNLSLSEDRKSGFVTLSIKHQSPFIAKQWVELIVNEINGFYRQKDKLESEKSVSYLNQQISKTDLSEINQVLAQLLQEETKKLTLIEANQFYVFDYIDLPAAMELKSEPNRALICIFIALIGGIFSVILVLIRHYAFSGKA